MEIKRKEKARSFHDFLNDVDTFKMGSRRKDIDWESFDKLCFMQCTKLECAAWFGMTQETLEKRVKEKYNRTFYEVFTEKKQAGHIALRRSQWRNALNCDSASMQIWLDKKHLGGTEVDKQEAATVVVEKIEVNIVDLPAQALKEKAYLDSSSDIPDDSNK